MYVSTCGRPFSNTKRVHISFLEASHLPDIYCNSDIREYMKRKFQWAHW